MCYLSLEKQGLWSFHNDAHEVEDKVCELKKIITLEDRGILFRLHPPLALEIFPESDEAQIIESPF